jgi:hypothetical protein
MHQAIEVSDAFARRHGQQVAAYAAAEQEIEHLAGSLGLG